MNYSRRQLEAFGEPLGESVTRLKPGGRIYGGGGSKTPAQTSQTNTTDLPAWAKPHAKEILARGQALSNAPYEKYGGDRTADFGDMQKGAMEDARTMGPAAQLGTATGLAGDVGRRAMGTNYEAGQFANQFQAPDAYQAGQFNPANVQAQGLQQYQMGPAERVRTQSFARPGAAESFMSPYMQNVVDVQQRQAQRQADVARTGRSAQAVGAGAFGGSRQAIMESEAARNLAQQKGDIQAQGLQSAYGQAQQQFNAEQQARLQAQQANQQAGLTVGGQNLGALLGVQQFGAGQNLQAQLANQQMGLNAQQMYEQSRQFGAGQGLQAAGLGAQYGQAAQQLGEQSRQYGAGLGMQGLQTALQSAGQLGQLGGQQFQQGMDINKLRSAYGGMEQGQRQRDADIAYQNFVNQQSHPYKQVGFYSDLLRGTPTGSSSVTNMYQPQGSGLQDAAGLAMGMYGLSKYMAEGGEVKTYAGDQGSVTSQGNVESIIDRLGPEQLQQARENALDRRDMDTVAAIDERMAELAQSKSLTAGLGSAFDQIPADQQENIMSAANGGIVAMAGGGSYRQKTDEALKGLTDLAGSYKPQTAEQYQAGVEKQMPFVEKLYGPDITAGYLEEVKAERAGLGKNMDEAKGLGALLAAAEMIGARNFREGASKSVKAFTGEVARVAKETKEAKDRLRQSEITLATAQQARKEGLVGKATALEDKAEQQRLKGIELDINAKEKIAQLNSGLASTEMQTAASFATAKMAANKETDLARQTNIRYAALIEEGKPANKKTMAEAAAMAASDLGRYPGAEKLDVAREAAAAKSKKEANESWGNAVLTDKNLRKTYSNLQKADPTGEQAAAFKDKWVAREMGAAPAAAPQAAPAAAPQAAAPVAKPSMQAFMDAARKANPGVSDADLAAYYNRKYGK
jgi:hypothetical protein